MAANPGSIAELFGTTSLAGFAFLLLTLFVCINLFVFAHELGHALAGLAFTHGLVIVRVGRSPAMVRRRVGRLALELNPLPPRKGQLAGSAATYAHLSRSAFALLVFAGPFLGGAASLVMIEVGTATHIRALVVAGALGAFNTVVNLVPRARDGRLNDGARILATLRRRPIPGAVFAGQDGETLSRWLVLYTDPRGSITGDQHLQLGGAPVAMGHAPDDRGPEATALWQFAFAGWCWREAERGDTAPVRECVLNARHRASAEALSRSDIVVVAARNVAGGDVDLTLGSPTATSLAEGVKRARAGIRPAVADEWAEFAFRFGVALHDVERIAG